MIKQSFTIESIIDKEVFTDFSYFHNFILGNRKNGFIFSTVFLIIMAFINLFTDSFVLFLLCMGLAFGVPILYYLFYKRSLNNQIKINHLDSPKQAYTLTIDNRGVSATTETEHALYKWNDIFRAYRTSKYFYFYIIKNKALILPVSNLVNLDPNTLWTFITAQTNKNKYFPNI